jgi:hypothetical protein
MDLNYYVELLKRADDMSFATDDDKKRFTLIIKRIIKKMTGVAR